MSYYGKLTGKYYDSIESLRHHEQREAQRRNIPTEEQAAFDNLPAEKIRELFNQAALGEQAVAAQQQTVIDLEVFKQLHPEFKPGPANRNAIILALRAIGADVENGIASPGQLEKAFEVCKANGSLDLDETVLQKQQLQGAEQRANAIREKRAEWANFDESQAEGLSLDELRQRAADQLAWSGWAR